MDSHPTTSPFRIGRMIPVIICVLALSMNGSKASATEPVAFDFNFATSNHGFIGGFADYPTDAEAPTFYALTNDWRPRPAYLGGAPALFISGDNHSDDLFMYWKKALPGFAPNGAYRATFELEFASSYATGLSGVGGSPGDSVALKVGGAGQEPLAVAMGDHWRMNLDKGNQFSSGTNMLVIGTIAKPEDDNADYVPVTRATHDLPMTLHTANNGTLWLVFGTDSGFEAVTSLYYNRLKVWLSPQGRPALWSEWVSPSSMRLIWHEGVLQTSTNLTMWTDLTQATSPQTNSILNERTRFWRVRR